MHHNGARLAAHRGDADMANKTWVVYNTNTLRAHKTWKQSTRAARDAESRGAEFAVLEESKYNALVEGKTRTVRNLMTGAEVEIAVNTPLCCDPSSDVYWSM
jgi:hypothetical protein